MKKAAPKTAPKPVQKRVSTPGKFVYKPITSKISECKCGNKYVATRPRQKTCIRCMFENVR